MILKKILCLRIMWKMSLSSVHWNSSCDLRKVWEWDCDFYYYRTLSILFENNGMDSVISNRLS